MKIGIMGGSFDPIHSGHIDIAKKCKDEFELDKIMFLPSGDPPHKKDITPKEIRIEMVSSAIKNIDNFFISRMEADRKGKTYTYDTALTLKESNDEYFALMVANRIFGGGAHSKLFNNVREKLSLCYYAYSRLDKYNGIMMIGSGIEFEKFQMTKDAILSELDAVKKGDFSDAELDIAKEYIISTFTSYTDSPGSCHPRWWGICGSPHRHRPG